VPVFSPLSYKLTVKNLEVWIHDVPLAWNSKTEISSHVVAFPLWRTSRDVPSTSIATNRSAATPPHRKWSILD
jgi:hypothetical protein